MARTTMTAEVAPIGPLLNTLEAARALRLSASTLHTWRSHGVGPQYVKLGGRVFYRPEALARFMEAGTVKANGE
jgi:hypothetical protein